MAAPKQMLGVIVEGHGEVQAVPALVRRIAYSIRPDVSFRIEARRVPKSLLLQPGQLERLIEAFTRQIGRQQPLLILLDADDDCPRDLASNLAERCEAAHKDVAISIVIANREYEAWFLAAAGSLAGQGGLTAQLSPPIDPESIRGAKEWLTANMTAGHSYSETRHQSAFSSLMDLSEARRARSFTKLEREVRRMLGSHSFSSSRV